MRVLALLTLTALTFAGCSGLFSDNDDLDDRTEKDGWVIQVRHLDYIEERHVTSDPGKDDTDGDGLDDDLEFALQSDPRSVDTDGDGLGDCHEVLYSDPTHCNADNPPFADGGTGTNPSMWDSGLGPSRYANRYTTFYDQYGEPEETRYWGSGVGDRHMWEIWAPFLANESIDYWPRGDLDGDSQPNMQDVDGDGDGLEVGEELFLYNADPILRDTDGDGCIDGQDPWPDRKERYQFRLESLELDNDTDGVRIHVQIGRASAVLPNLDASYNLKARQVVYPTVNTTVPFALVDCHVSPIVPPYNPIVYVTAFASDEDGNTLDLGASQLAWNVRNGFIRENGSAMHAITDGKDGEMTFSLLLTTV